MANGDERFVEVFCEMTDQESPEEIRERELLECIARQAIDSCESIDFDGVDYHKIIADTDTVDFTFGTYYIPHDL